MISKIEKPSAVASVRWLTAAEGGRRSGPPNVPVYAATCVFPRGGDEEVVPGWPASADQLSILVEPIDAKPKYESLAKIGFLAPELAQPYLHVDQEILILEGPRVVARAAIQGLCTSD